MVTIEDHSADQHEDLESHACSDVSPGMSSQPGLDLKDYGESSHSNEEDKETSHTLDYRDRGNNQHHQVNHEGDDWETASEGDDDDARASTSANAIESYEDALTEEEQRQKALAQADSAKVEGNALYATGKYEEALEHYATALEILAEIQNANEARAVCYSNRAVCFLQLGNFKEVVTESSKALELKPDYVKALLRRSQGQENLDQLDEALADMKKVLELDPTNKQARDAIRRIEPLAAEKREKMKEEMIGKLKEVGNSILGRFGMSVDNFKAVQDPNTGSYSISFQR